MNIRKSRTISLLAMILSFGIINAETMPFQGGDQPTLHIDFDACVSFFGGYNVDYSEFTATSDIPSNCGAMFLSGPGHVYRRNANLNTHSCTPGIDSSSLAMCITGLDNCTYVPNDDKALRFDVTLIPGLTGMAALEHLSFYEQAPDQFNFHQGQSGENDYPTKLALRVMANGMEILRIDELTTSRDWTLMEFNFSDYPEFTVNVPTVFNFEILPYCLVGRGGDVQAWDIDNLTLTGSCNNFNAGFVKLIGALNNCNNDTISRVIDFEAENAFGDSLKWLVTNLDGEILEILTNDSYDFDARPNGRYAVYHIAHTEDLTGLELGNNIADLVGCFDLSSRVIFTNNKLEAGILRDNSGMMSGFICEEFGNVTAYSLNYLSATAEEQTILIMDDSLNILQIESNFPIDLSNLGDVPFVIQVAGHNGQLFNAAPGNNLSNLGGCFVLSNAYNVLGEIKGGVLNVNQTEFCVDNGQDDFIIPFLTQSNRLESTYLLTTLDSQIINRVFPPVNVENLSGSCILWHVSSVDTLDIQIGQDISDIDGCLDFSNGVIIEKNEYFAGSVFLQDSSSVIDICVLDSITNDLNVFNTGFTLGTYNYVVTDSTGVVLEVNDTSTLNFDNAPTGVCFIYGFTSDGGLNLMVGDTLSEDLIDYECYDISDNFITVNRFDDGAACGVFPCDVTAGFIDLFNSQYCIGDGVEDLVNGEVIGASGAFTQLVVTNADSSVLATPPGFGFDVDGADPGTCLVWHIVSDDTIVVDSASFIQDFSAECFAVSQPASFDRILNNGGTLSISGDSTFVNICVTDSIADQLQINSNGAGDIYQYIITDTFNIIQAVVDSALIDFDQDSIGVCRIWGIAYNGAFNLLVGAELMEPSVPGFCYNLSNNFITVNKFDCIDAMPCEVEAGIVELFSTEFCIGDGVPDLVNGNVIGAVGDFTQLIVTDENGVIIDLPSDFGFDVDGAEPGTCIIYNMVSTDSIDVTIGSNIDAIQGDCFDISNATTFDRLNAEGGLISFANNDTTTQMICVGDMSPDILTIFRNVTTIPLYQYIVVDSNNVVIALPGTNQIDFEGFPVGTCSIYGLSYSGSLTLGVGDTLFLQNPASQCFDYSDNVLSVEKVDCSTPVEAGQISLSNGTLMYCPGDTTGVMVTDGIEFNITQTGQSNVNSTWVVTDAAGIIDSLFFSSNIITVDLNPLGTYYLYFIVYDNVSGLIPGMNINALTGDFDLSNNIELNSSPCEMPCDVAGGFIDLFGSNYCIGDGVQDIVTGDIQGASGDFSKIILTDADSVVINTFDTLSFDVDLADAGTCLVWHMSSNDTINVAVDTHIEDIDIPCFDLSPAAAFNRITNFAGTVSFTNGTVLDTFCVGDNIQDNRAFANTGSSQSYQYVVVDSSNVIIGLPSSNSFNFDTLPPGICLVYGVAYSGVFLPEIGDVLTNMPSTNNCFDISDNAITVVKEDCTVMTIEAGEIALIDGTTTYCPDDTTATLSSFAYNVNQFSASLLFRGISEVDFDGDIYPDFLYIESQTFEHVEYDATLDGIVSNTITHDFQFGFGLSEAVDMNDDGALDIVVSSFDATELDMFLLTNDGSNNFTSTELVDGTWNAMTGSPSEMKVFDVDNDNDLDIVAINAAANPLFERKGVIYTNDGNGNFTVSNFDVGTPYSGLAVGHLDDNQMADVLVMKRVTNQDSLFIFKDVTGSNTRILVDAQVTNDQFADLDNVTKLIDADGDGDLDIFLFNSQSSNFLYINESGSWSKTQLMGDIHINPDTEVIDVDNDGDLDITTIRGIQLNDGNYNFSLLDLDFDLSGISCHPIVSDVDGDGLMDIITSPGEWYDFTQEAGNYIFDVQLTNSSSGLSDFWVLTDSQDTIVEFIYTDSPLTIDLQPAGTYYLYHIVIENVQGVVIGANINDITGSFDLSNSIELNSTPCDMTTSPPELTIVFNRVGEESVIFDIKNISQDTIDVSDYWICRGPGMYDKISDIIVECGQFSNLMAPGDIKGLNLGIDNDDGELGLYTTNSFTDPDAIIHYVEWGNANHARSTVAVAAGLWTAGDFVPAISDNRSIYFDGDGFASSDWTEGVTSLCGELPPAPTSEIVFNRVGASFSVVDLINIGQNTIDVTDYHIRIDQNTSFKVGNLMPFCGDINYIVAPGERIGVQLESTTISEADGELALYSSASNLSFNIISDYVQWGNAGHPLENSAASAGIWTAGDFVPAISTDQSIYYDGEGDASTDWSEAATVLCGEANANNDGKLDFSIAPNPATDKINMQILQSPTAQVTVAVYNGQGEMIEGFELDLSSENDIEMTVSDLPVGMYFVTVRSKGFSNSKRFIIAK